MQSYSWTSVPPQYVDKQSVGRAMKRKPYLRSLAERHMPGHHPTFYQQYYHVKENPDQRRHNNARPGAGEIETRRLLGDEYTQRRARPAEKFGHNRANGTQRARNSQRAKNIR